MDYCVTALGDRRYSLGWLGAGFVTLLLSTACGRSAHDTPSGEDLPTAGGGKEASSGGSGVSTGGNGRMSTGGGAGASSGRGGDTSSEGGRGDLGQGGFGGSYPDIDWGTVKLPFKSCDEFLAFVEPNTRADEFVFSISGAEVWLPLVQGGSYNFEVDWGDGSRDVITSAGELKARHVYDTDSVHVVRVRGLVRGWSYGNSSGNPAKKLEIARWGSLQLGDTDRQFEKLSLSLCATDAPDLSKTDSLEGLFHGSHLSRRCPVPNMTGKACDSLADLSKWDVSNITNMYELFAGASGFSNDLSNWHVSNVANMGAMFASALTFNGNLSAWDVSNVTNMSSMFDTALDFNGDLSRWDVSKVTDMSRMFGLAQHFNGDLSAWNVSNVESIHHMFYLASSFAGDLSDWDLPKVTDMSYLFYTAELFNSDLSKWDVSHVSDMSFMFYGAESFNADVSGWDVSKVTDMSDMFHFAYAFNRDLSKWKVSKVTSMTNMFFYATAFNGGVAGWDVSSVTDMSYMFHYAENFNGDVSSWNVAKVADMTSMFVGSAHSRGNYDALLSNWSTLPVRSGVTFETSANFSAGTAAAARTSLIAKGWTIVDAGVAP